MKRVTYGTTSVLVGDEFADLLLEYAAALARSNLSEPLHFRGIGDEGEQELAIIVGPATEIITSTTEEALVQTDPVNTDAVTIMGWRIGELK